MAPTKYEEVDLLEVGEDVRRPMTKGRIVGVAVVGVALAVVGLVGVFTLPKKPLSQMKRLSVVHGALLKAFSKRSLQELEQTKTRVSFTVMQEGIPIGDDGLSIHATVSANPDAGPDVKPHLEVQFDAQEGKGADMQTALINLARAIMDGHDKKELKDGEDGESILESDDGGSFTFKSTEDSAQFTMVPPDNQEFDDDMAEGMNENVKFEALFKLGRTLDELYEDNVEHLPMSLHGLQISSESTVVAVDIICMMDKNLCDAYSALTQVNTSIDIRYRNPEELSDRIKNAFPTLRALMQSVGVERWPKEIKDAVTELGGLTKGIKSIAIRGLPNNFEIVFNCRNFKLTKVLKKLIEMASPTDAK